VKLFRASADDIVGALLLPSPRDGQHDAATYDEARADRVERKPLTSASLDAVDHDDSSRVVAALPAQSGLPAAVEAKLAQLAGVEPPTAVAPDDDDGDEQQNSASRTSPQSARCS
jgi:hypothetical protein